MEGAEPAGSGPDAGPRGAQKEVTGIYKNSNTVILALFLTECYLCL